jgi:hypothetical protein
MAYPTYIRKKILAALEDIVKTHKNNKDKGKVQAEEYSQNPEK